GRRELKQQGAKLPAFPEWLDFAEETIRDCFFDLRRQFDLISNGHLRHLPEVGRQIRQIRAMTGEQLVQLDIENKAVRGLLAPTLHLPARRNSVKARVQLNQLKMLRVVRQPLGSG